MEYQGLAVQLKQQLNDIIDVAYKDRNERQLKQLKRFTLSCIDKEVKSFNGDCRYMPDGSSQIRILRLQNATYRAILLTTIHEVSHHIAYSLFREHGHGSKFYKVHMDLLFASFDMGILTKNDVIYSGSTSRSLNKVIINRHMLDAYKPNPVQYKQDVVQIFVYNVYAVKDVLKARGYKWNALDTAWVLESDKNAVNEEQAYLQSIGVHSEDIKVVNSSQVISRLRKTVSLYNVAYEDNERVKKLGYHWNDAAKVKCWQKKIDGDTLSRDEDMALRTMPNVRVVIS